MGQIGLISLLLLGQNSSVLDSAVMGKQTGLTNSKSHSNIAPLISQRITSPSLPVAPNSSLAQFLPITATASLANQTIDLEVTRTAEQQSKGLMYRDRLPDNRGMLFPFDPPTSVSFWMKNCAVPLDMVFIYKKRIVAIAPSAPPCTQDPCPTYPNKSVLVDQVIELRENWAAEKGLKVGDRVEVKFKQN